MKAFSKVVGWASVVGALLLFLPLRAHSVEGHLGTMRVSLVHGDVQVKIAETEEWVPAAVNMPLVEGDELWVPEDSHAAIQTNNGAYIRLSTETAIQVLRADRNSFQFFLPQGYAYVLSLAPRRSVLQFDTPDGSIRAFGSATFRIDIPDGETDVSVFKGSVLAENVAGTTRVGAGRMLAFGEDGFAELSPLPPPDDWQHWNERRDRIALARGTGYRYMPDELRVYAGDLDQNGRWINVPEYGYVWTPTVAVTADWAPYRHGRWVWRGGEYVWIGYEPWGWAPYHYGRWTFIVRVGWCWVPPARGDVYWGPGYVGWVRSGDYVAWVPLAPRDTYYGHGHFGRHSVNVTNVNINQVRVTNVYQNVNVTNSVTVVNQNTFVTGRPAPVHQNVVVNVKEDFARRRNIVVGRPPIKPVETSYVPVVRQIPEAKQPPQAIRRIDVRELKQSRPLVKEAEKSALRPQAPARPLEVRQVEKPRSLSEKIRERERRPEREQRPVAPSDQRGPGTLRGAPQREAPEQERARPERPKGMPERGFIRRPPQPSPEERGRQERSQGAPTERDRRQDQAAPPEKGRPQEQAAPPERGTPQEPPIRRGKQREQAAPPEKGRPQERAAPPEKGRPKAAPPEKQEREVPTDNTSQEGPRGERGGGRGRR